MKWAIREAVDVYFKAKSVFKLGARTIRAGEPVLIFDTVKTSTLEVASETSYVTGGRGNTRLLAYEGDKTMTFNFEDALLSNEGLAILAGAELIPARNKYLKGASPDARSIISHTTEKFSVTEANRPDTDTVNNYEVDSTIAGKPCGGNLNVWLKNKPYIGQNASIYVMLLDDYGEMSGAPIEINLKNQYAENSHKSALAVWSAAEKFIAFDKRGKPLATTDTTALTEAAFDDKVGYYVDVDTAIANWADNWGTAPIKDTNSYTDDGNFIRTTGALTDNRNISNTALVGDNTKYGYLLGQPKCFREGSQFVYKVNVPSILQGDIVLIDYYVEHRHDASQISILPDKFSPYMYVEGSSLVRRASDGMDLPVEFVIPKFKISTALTFTLTSSGDASTFNFQGDAYPDYSKFDMTRKVFADIQILDADDNYDGGTEDAGDPTDYRRYRYNEDSEGEYVWKDPTLPSHSNLDYSDPNYDDTKSGPVTYTDNDPVAATPSGTVSNG